MSIELITGRAGKPHVDSQDVRAYQAYTAGSGRYVLHGATCSVESANEVSIAPGEILVDGTHVRVMGDGETVTIGNGQTGYKRSDIVALHYTVTGSGESIVESMEFTVVQGSPSDTEPEDPDMPASGSILDGVTETYVPYARVIIDGLSPQEPEVLVEQYALPSAMGGIPSGGDHGNFLAKASSADYDTGWLDAEQAIESLGMKKLLWSGTWSSGELTIPEIMKYRLFSFRTSPGAWEFIGHGHIGVNGGITIQPFQNIRESATNLVMGGATIIGKNAAGTVELVGPPTTFSLRTQDKATSSIVEIYGIV